MILNLYACWSYEFKGFLNLIKTLLWFYLEIFMWLNEFLPIIETLLWLKVFTLMKINRDFTLIN